MIPPLPDWSSSKNNSTVHIAEFMPLIDDTHIVFINKNEEYINNQIEKELSDFEEVYCYILRCKQN